MSPAQPRSAASHLFFGACQMGAAAAVCKQISGVFACGDGSGLPQCGGAAVEFCEEGDREAGSDGSSHEHRDGMGGVDDVVQGAVLGMGRTVAFVGGERSDGGEADGATGNETGSGKPQTHRSAPEKTMEFNATQRNSRIVSGKADRCKCG